MPEETKEELNEETTSTEEAPAEEKQEGEDLAARLAKAEEEKENYKKMALKYKEDAKPKTLEVEEETYPDWNEETRLLQKQTINLAKEAAASTMRQQIEKVNEKNAIAQFIEQNPELSDDSKWQTVIKNYQPRSKESVQDIIKDLGRAKVLAEYEGGTLGKTEKKPDVSELGTVGRTTSKSTTEGKTLTQSEINIGKAMKVDLEKLAEEDMTKPATIEIN